MRPEAPSDPQVQTLELPRGSIAYCSEGHLEPALLMVHGVPGSSRDFRWLAPCVEGLRVVRIEMPGFGSSPLATEPSPQPAARARILMDFIRALRLDRPVVVGHSMGGVHAAATGAFAPDLVRGVGLLCSPGLRRHRALDPRLRIWSAALKLQPVEQLFRGRAKRLFEASGFRHSTHDERMLSLHSAAALSTEDHARRLRRLRVPTFHAFTKDDPMVQLSITQESADVTGGESICFDDGGHNPQKHHAVELGAALARWARALAN